MIILQEGNSGPYVQMLQLALQRAGYDVTPDGQYTQSLAQKVREFQRENGIETDGIAGNNTWQLLIPYITGYKDSSALPFDVVPEGIAYTAELVDMIIQGLTARYPFIETGSIGKSVMGKNIPYIKIGAGEREVFYNAEHHANEWITTPVLLKFAEDYLKAYTEKGTIDNKSAENLYNTKTLYIVPAVNPDGLDAVNGALPVGEYYNNVLAISKNYPQIPFPDGWKANIAGTDLNLNYPANWNKAKQNKYALGFTTPAPRDYVGTEPLSALESLAVYNFTNQHRFVLTLSYHAQGKVIYWKYLDYQPENSYKIGQALSKSSGYSLDLTPPESAYAGYKDWFIQAYNKPGYTVEVGTGTSPLPWSQFDEIYEDNLPLLATALEMA